MHVIPVEKAIETEQEAIGLEKISYWLHKYEGKYAKSMCSCRASRDKLGEGCGDDVENWCIAVGDMADYVVQTQRGEYITYDEAMAIFKQAEDNGFVHQITNIDGEQKIFGICNCNVNVCNALRTSQLFNTPNMSRSAYVAAVETEKCVACGRCVENCPAGAVKLGQKLCTKDGYIEYPRAELPDEVKWGPEKWSVDYRDRNRINCYDTGTAPCKTACPAHIAVQGYLKLAAQGKYREAPHLQPPVRGCLHPRHRGRGRGHRRGKALYCPAGSGRGDALHPGEGHSQGGRRIQRKDRHHRWRPRRHELRLLSGGKGLSPHGV